MSTPSAYLVVSPEMAKFLQDNDKSFKGNSLDPGGVIGWLDGIEIRVGSEPSINTIGRLIKRKENLEAVMTFLDASGFDIDFSDTSEDTVEVEVKYREEDLGIFECSGLLNLKDEIWGIIKYCYDWYIKRRPKEEAVLKFHKEMSPYDYPVLAETKVYNNFNPLVPKMKTTYCGTFDILYYRYFPDAPDKSGFVIKDYKTNRELTSDYNRGHSKTCLAPFADLIDEALSMYILQLSCYQIPLEDLGVKVIDREIIWLKDNGNYELIHLPDYSGRLRSVL